jgi:hypothetical protein
MINIVKNIVTVPLVTQGADRERAEYQESLSTSLMYEDRTGALLSLIGLAGVATCTCQAESAALLFGFADRQLELLGRNIHASDYPEHFQWHLSLLKKQLDPTVLANLWQQGRDLSREQAVTIGLAIQAPEQGSRKEDP